MLQAVFKLILEAIQIVIHVSQTCNSTFLFSFCYDVHLCNSSINFCETLFAVQNPAKVK